MARTLVATLLGCALALTSCAHRHHSHDPHEHAGSAHPGGGPPPWAPAHGYRHKHQGGDLRFDAQLGVYVVIGHPHLYFHGSHYLRHVDARWERCRDWRQPTWKPVDVQHVPSGLVRHYADGDGKPGKGRGRGHGRGPGKGPGPAKRGSY